MLLLLLKLNTRSGLPETGVVCGQAPNAAAAAAAAANGKPTHLPDDVHNLRDLSYSTQTQQHFDSNLYTLANSTLIMTGDQAGNMTCPYHLSQNSTCISQLHWLMPGHPQQAVRASSGRFVTPFPTVPIISGESIEKESNHPSQRT